MIVDDSLSMREYIQTTLSQAGYRVIQACHGKDAILRLPRYKIDLFISDVNMPVMDGISMVKEIKKMADYRFTPVIMLSTESSRATKNQGKEAGATGWIVKPFKPEKLLQAVSLLIGE